MNANALRGLYSLSVEATEAIAEVRAQIAGLIGAVDEAGKPCASEVVFTRNTSESLNIVASSFAPTVLEPGDEVAITIMEHHSNLIPWQHACRAAGASLVYLYPTKTGKLTDAEIAAKIGPRTKIVACTQVSNVLGCRVPVESSALPCTPAVATWWSMPPSPCRTCRSTCTSWARTSSPSPPTRPWAPWAWACSGAAWSFWRPCRPSSQAVR